LLQSRPRNQATGRIDSHFCQAERCKGSEYDGQPTKLDVFSAA